MIASQDGPSLAGTPATPALTSATQAAPAGKAAPQSAPGAEMFWVFIPVLLGMVALSAFSARKQRKQKEKLLGGLKKHDRVVTTGGMIGYVAEVKPDVVVLKVEEGRDVRLTFTRDAIAAVVKSADPVATSETPAETA
ncbi:MAG: preprotein translocase subunit YajC [Planctomycetes bacterium]|nr:preprotein translocase subunit YajC [Planctomycetota bacterium]